MSALKWLSCVSSWGCGVSGPYHWTLPLMLPASNKCHPSLLSDDAVTLRDRLSFLLRLAWVMFQYVCPSIAKLSIERWLRTIGMYCLPELWRWESWDHIPAGLASSGKKWGSALCLCLVPGCVQAIFSVSYLVMCHPDLVVTWYPLHVRLGHVSSIWRVATATLHVGLGLP